MLGTSGGSTSGIRKSLITVDSRGNFSDMTQQQRRLLRAVLTLISTALTIWFTRTWIYGDAFSLSAAVMIFVWVGVTVVAKISPLKSPWWRAH